MITMKGVEGTWVCNVKFLRNYLNYIFRLLTRLVALCVVFCLIAILSLYSKDGGIEAASFPDNNQAIVEMIAVECPPYEPDQVTAIRSYLMLAQACPSPPQCAQNQRPCNIRYDENNCITWNCCEK
jgi:hypothetical protein